MKKILISLVFIGAFASYAFYNYYSTKSADAAAASSAAVTTTAVTTNDANPTPSTPTTSAVQVTTSASVPVSTPAPVKKSSGQYTDGVYTGNPEDAYYGTVQVEATVSGGKLTKVTFLQYPSDRSTSLAISRRAMPTLSAEAVQIQSSNVDGVSGASDTSAAFTQSLASALSQAKA